MTPTKTAKAVAYYGRRAEFERTHGRDGSAYARLAEAHRLALVAEDRCTDCGRPLSDPVSIARGVGPDCFAARQERTDG